MINVSWLAIKYSRITISFWLAVSVAGIMAFTSLKYALFPDITFPVVVVRIQSNLEQVLDVEKSVTTPIESAFESLSNVTDIESTIYPKQTIVSLLFDTGTSLKNAVTNVEQKMSDISFTEDVRWKVIPLNLNESTAVSYIIKSDRFSLEELTQITHKEIVPVISSLSGVAKVEVLGNIKESKNLVRFNGADVLAIRIVKSESANTLDLVKKVARISSKLPEKLSDVELIVAETQAKYIEEATQATIDALWGAIVLAVMTIFVFLGDWKATLITAIAIPISLLGTFLVMAIMGFNLETLTLLALALVIGIIVDDAIVEVENIMRHLETQKTPRKAAFVATREIGVTVAIATLTIVAVFLPVALMGGTLGKFFRPFGLTLSAAVLISLLVARTLSPVLAVWWLKKTRGEEKKEKGKGKLKNILINQYRSLLSWSLSHRKIVIAIAIVISLTGVSLIPFIPQGFTPNLDRGEFNLIYTTSLPPVMPPLATQNEQKVKSKVEINSQSNFSWLKKIADHPETILLRKTMRVGEKLERVLLTIPEVENVYNIAGIRGEPNKGKIYIKLKSSRDLTTEKVQEKIHQNLPKLAQVTVSIEDIPFVETGDDSGFKIALVGNNLQSLQSTAIAIKKQISSLPELVNLRITGEELPITIITHLNQQRVIYLTANLSQDTAIGDITPKVVAIANSLLPPDVKINVQGESARASSILKEFGLTLIIAIALMLGILYLPFRRWLEPLVIALSLPLAIIGAMFALLITQSEFGMISLIGLIFLLGLLDKNAILLMDYTNQLRKSGMTRTEAILETGIIRLRPIIMTTFSTILGMLPIALGWGAGAELRQPMAVAIIGGLLASSILSLIVVPVLYTLLEDYSVGN